MCVCVCLRACVYMCVCEYIYIRPINIYMTIVTLQSVIGIQTHYS